MKNANSTATGCKTDGSKKGRAKPNPQDASSNALLRRPRNRIDESLRALSLTREQLAACAPLEALLKESLGNVASAIEAMRFSHDSTILRFLARYNEATETERKNLPLEAFALAAEVDIAALLGATMIAFKSLQAQKSTLHVMSEHPEIVRKTVEFAKKSRGVADRRMIHEAVGFLPTKAGISITQTFGGQPVQQTEKPPLPNEVNGEEVEFSELFRPITNDLEDWQANKAKLLKE